MVTKLIFSVALVMLSGLTWNTARAFGPQPDGWASGDAYTSGLFLDYLRSTMRPG